jgi:hypothetical protein
MQAPPTSYGEPAVAPPLYAPKADSWKGSPGQSPATVWDPMPPYSKQEYYSPAIGPDGHVLVEVDNTPARPIGKDGVTVHELG